MTLIFHPPRITGTGWTTGPNKGGTGCYTCGATSCLVHCRNCGADLNNEIGVLLKDRTRAVVSRCPPCEDEHLSKMHPEVM